MNKEDFIVQKQRVSLSGEIDERFTPYMFEFYKFKCKEKNYKLLITDINIFNLYLDRFLNIPVSFGENFSELMLNQRFQTINKGIKETIKYFDKLYEIK